MSEIIVSIDSKGYRTKPTNSDCSRISIRIGKASTTLNCPNSVNSFVRNIGQHGYTFSPATFINGRRKAENFEQMQLLVLDFDGTISYEAVCNRARQYDLPILFAYDTFSSKNYDRFRIVFLNDISISDKRAAKIYKNALMTIFPECIMAEKSYYISITPYPL